MSIHGRCDPRFRAVREEFERNFDERGEVGASVCVIVDGRTVVDLWAGVAERSSGRPWEPDTLVLVWSCTKAIPALAAHILRARGLLDLDAPVTRYWPEFGQAGKDGVTVRMLLDHQSGLPAVRRPLKPGGVYDWDYMIETLAAEEPFWEPGTRQAYQATTFGHLVGEVVQRVAGRPLDRFYREEVAGPLSLDFHLGLPPADEPRVAPIIRPEPPPPGQQPSRFSARAYADPRSVQALIMRNTGRHPGTKEYDSPAAHQSVLPSQGGLASARGLAQFYAPLALGGSWNGVRLLDEDTLRELAAVHSASAVDGTLLMGVRFGLGFCKSSDNRAGPPGARDSLILSEEAFGHPGMGGSLGFVDPAARLSFGYVMNKQGRGVCLNERGQSLVDAVYRSLGYHSDARGRWM